MQFHQYPLPRTYMVTRTYRILFLLYPVISMIFTLLMVATLFRPLIAGSEAMITLPAFMLLMTGLSIAFYRSFIKTHLVFAPEGITVYKLGMRIFSPWHNIACFDTIWTPFRCRGFRLHTPALPGQTLEYGKYYGVAVIESSWWQPINSTSPYTVFLPIDRVVAGRNWLKKEIGAYIRHYAPNFSETPLPKQKLPLTAYIPVVIGILSIPLAFILDGQTLSIPALSIYIPLKGWMFTGLAVSQLGIGLSHIIVQRRQRLNNRG